MIRTRPSGYEPDTLATAPPAYYNKDIFKLKIRRYFDLKIILCDLKMIF